MRFCFRRVIDSTQTDAGIGVALGTQPRFLRMVRSKLYESRGYKRRQIISVLDARMGLHPAEQWIGADRRRRQKRPKGDIAPWPPAVETSRAAAREWGSTRAGFGYRSDGMRPWRCVLPWLVSEYGAKPTGTDMIRSRRTCTDLSASFPCLDVHVPGCVPPLIHVGNVWTLTQLRWAPLQLQRWVRS